MTTPDWQERLTMLQNINEPPKPKPDPNAIHLTITQLDQLLGQNANPFCGLTAVWAFTKNDWPFAGKPGLWRQAEKLPRPTP
jgi:hypothetical protein